MDDKDKKIEQLTKENDYLRKMLKDHNIDFELPSIIEPSILPTNERVELFLSYFKGRNDIFAYQYINSEGKKSCYPVCKYKTNVYPYCQKGRKCSSCDIKEYRGINSEDVLDHFKGKNIYGIYPLLDDSTTNFLAFDFDDKDYKSSALTFAKICCNLKN